MFESLLNAFRAPDIRRRILYVLALLIVFRLLAAVPVPGIDKKQLADFVSGNALIGLLDTMTPFENQRVTAEMEAVDVVEIVSTMPAELITTQPFELIDEVEPDEQPAGSTTSSLDFVVRWEDE